MNYLARFVLLPKHHARFVSFAVLLFVLCLSTSILQAQTTAFTYQGRLTDINNNPVNGSYDFEFRLLDPNGTQLGVSVPKQNVAVNNGIFSVTLDFGSGAFQGANRFLEISVRAAGSATYAKLGAPQQLTSAPYALRSLSAASADTAVNATTATSFSGTLAGDITGTQSATVIANNTVTTVKLADNSVTNAKIVDVAGSKVTGTIPVAGIPAGSGNYIQNTTTRQTSSNFNISGDGTAGGTLTASLLDAASQFNIGGNRVLSGTAASQNLFVGIGAGNTSTTGTQNSFVARSAGSPNTSGTNNSFFGRSAGGANTIGNNNSFFGRNAGGANTTGLDNSFFGTDAGFTNIDGQRNSFFGISAGGRNASGNDNAFFGYNAGSVNTASSNAFFGAVAGVANTTGTGNAFFGHSAGTANVMGNNLAFFGTAAGSANLVSNNSFFGYIAGTANTTGSNNSFFGKGAGSANLSGSFNTLVGDSAGNTNTTGGNNVFFGVSAGAANTTGNGNTIVGTTANVGANNLTNASAIGYQARVDCSDCLVLGSVSGVNGATASARIGIGTTKPLTALHIPEQGMQFGISSTASDNFHFASDTTGGPRALRLYNGNYSAGSQVLSVTATGSTGIGTPAPADKLHVNGDIRTQTGCVKNGAGNVIAGTCSSDLRFKRGIMPFLKVLPRLTQLQPVHFYWRKEEFPTKHFGAEQSYGLIAQEVEQVLPELVSEDEQGYKQVNYSKLPLLTLQAVKELKAENDTLKAQNDELREQSEILKKQNATIEARLAALEKLLQATTPVKQ